MITAGTLSLTGIVRARAGMWYVIPQFAGFLVFMVASFAETNRPPFDLVEAELVGGYSPSTAAPRSWPTCSPNT